MFNYANSVSELAHNIIKEYCVNFNTAIDATLGNGYDTDFLSSIFSKVYSFDIQKIATENYSEKCSENVTIINDSHENIDKYVSEKVDCIMYNLGYLPGGDKNITTKADTTLKSLCTALDILSSNGIIAICMYLGHEEGKNEKEKILNFVENLSKKDFSVVMHSYINRSNNPPILLLIEKK